MNGYNDVQRFLQALFGASGSKVVFANLNPAKHVRKVTELDGSRDCYFSIAAFPEEFKENGHPANRALDVRALVIDDVGTEISEDEVFLGLGEPTTIVESSAGNFQWGYRLSEPVPIPAWHAFADTIVRKLRGHEPHGISNPVMLFRLPFGHNTDTEKVPARNNFAVRLVHAKPEIELSVEIPETSATDKPETVSASGHYSRQELTNLMALIPNDARVDGRDIWVNIIGHGLKALCADDDEGFEVFDTWTQQHPRYKAGLVRKAWESFGAGGLKSKGGKLKGLARNRNPEKFTSWEAKTVFDDGEELPPEPTDDRAPAPRILSSGEFVDGFVPPNYLVEKLITRSYLYSLTGQTGAGKTSITLRLAATLALGRRFGGLETEQCRVLYIAAENPVDIQMRMIALAAEMGFEGSDIPMFFVRGRFSIKASMKALKEEALRVGGDFGLVVIDTGPVFFEGDDANDRVAMLNFARIMRDLIEIIPGKPAIIANMHPVKNADVNNLVPSGGGSFLNEVDGNLTAAKNEDLTIELHWQGKWRGVEFMPLDFLLKTVTHPRLVDSKGRPMPTVVCEHLSATAKEDMEQEVFTDEAKILAEMVRNPRVSYAELAVHMGWYFPFTGKPAKSKAQRYVNKLIKQKLVKKHLQLWVVAGMKKSKMNGHGYTTGDDAVSGDTIRGDTDGTKGY